LTAQELTNLVEGFANSPFNLLLVEKISAHEALEELIVKEAALGWIVRVASRSNGPIREKLWADIDRALTDLEKIAESQMHAGVGWPLPDSVDLRDEVICLS
jgi:hypothetical protein